MLQVKDIKNLNEIKELFTRGEKVTNILSDFYHDFFTIGIVNKIDSIKKRGYSGIETFLPLLILTFLALASIKALFTSGLSKMSEAEKDVYYRFKNRSDIDWRKIHYFFSKRFKKLVLLKGEQTDQKQAPSCFIIDDTATEKTGKRIEFIGKVFDHVKQNWILGFKELVLGYWDGKSFLPLDHSLHNEKGGNKKRPFGLSVKELKRRFSKKRDTSSPGKKRENELRESKISNAIVMIKRAVKNGFLADYVLIDKWFMSEYFIKEIRKIKKGLMHVLGMCKMDKRKYSYNGKTYSAKQLLAMLKPKKKRCRKINAWYIELYVEYKGIPLKLFYSRYSKRGKWQLLITTDMSLNYIRAIEIYNIRWSIEVFFKEAKQYLNFGKCASNDFDAQIADATISMIQYIILAFYKRFQSYETTGELFRASERELIELTLIKRLWNLFVELQLKIVEIFEIDINSLYSKILNNPEYEAVALRVVETIKAVQNDNELDIAA